MKKKIAYLLFGLLLIGGTSFVYSFFLGKNYPKDPEAAPFITSDIDHFWKAFDLFEQNPKQNPFQEHYISKGSKGLKDFIPNRIISAEALWNRVQKKQDRYLKVKANTLRIKDKEKECRQAFRTLQEWYPDAQFPPVYFVIGRFNSGGTQSNNGLIIGAEMQADLENVPLIVAHELIHFQQYSPFRFKSTLLEACLREGSADFIGELISGGHINEKAFAYGDQHKDRLCREFAQSMQQKNYMDWLYQTSKKDDRPNDLGYWMGYQITKAYFDKKEDKKAAIKEILFIKNAEKFLEQSGYLASYL